MKLAKSRDAVLVTGGCGYVGSHVTRQLSEAGYQAVVIDNLSSGFREALVHGEELVVADLGDERALADTFARYRFGTVMHFAASIFVPESVKDPLGYYDNNIGNAIRLLKACVRAQVPQFVFSSTAAVYGELGEAILRETLRPEPTNPYGRSKLMVEKILADTAAAHGLRFAALRYFNVAGADLVGRMGQRTPKATHLIKVACEAVLGKRQGLEIFGTDYPTPDGTCIRDYIHVEDVASAHLAAMTYLSAGGESDIFNCGYGYGSSVWDVLGVVEAVAGCELKKEIKPRRPGDVSILVADASKIRESMGWKPRYDNLQTIVQSALEWEKRLCGR